MNKSEYRGFSQVFRFTFKQAWKSNSLRISTFVMVLIMLVAFPVMAYFQKEDTDSSYNIEKVYVINDDEASIGLTASALKSGIADSENFAELSFEDSDKTKDELEEEIKKEHSNEVILSAVLDTLMGEYSFKLYYDPDSDVEEDELDELGADLSEWFDKYKLSAYEISEEARAMVSKDIDYDTASEEEYLADKEGNDVVVIDNNDYNVVYAVLMITYMVVIMSASMVGSKVAEEKTNRVVEYLMTTVRPMALITGKIVAMLLCAVGEVGAILLAGFISTKAAKLMFDVDMAGLFSGFLSTDAIKSLSFINIILCLIIMALGIYIFGLISGLFAASVSKMEELQQGMAACTQLIQIAFFASLAAVELMWTVGINTYVKFIMYFPVTSAFVMPGALFIGKAGIVDALIVIVLQAITALLVQKLVSMIYETIIMMNGSPIKLKQMIQIAKGAIADSRAKSRGGAGHEE